MKPFFRQKVKSPKETIDEPRNVYTEDELLLASTIYWWHKAYWEGSQSFTLQKSIGWLVSQITQINVNMISVMIREDQDLTVRDLEHVMNI